MASVNNEDGPYFAELLRVLDESAAWAARIGPGAERLLPATRSPLRGDDDRAYPYELSHAAWHSLSHAVDHLSCLRALLRDAKVVHMYAPFSLVRAALENACATLCAPNVTTDHSVAGTPGVSAWAAAAIATNGSSAKTRPI